MTIFAQQRVDLMLVMDVFRHGIGGTGGTTGFSGWRLAKSMAPSSPPRVEKMPVTTSMNRKPNTRPKMRPPPCCADSSASRMAGGS